METDSSDTFMKVAMGNWGNVRFKNAKDLLKYLGIITIIEDRT